jgi:Ni/Fe-hydrogenase subunit HybB-like protein
MATDFHYVPEWKEFAVAYGIVALAIAAFVSINKRVTVFLDFQEGKRSVAIGD